MECVSFLSLYTLSSFLCCFQTTNTGRRILVPCIDIFYIKYVSSWPCRADHPNLKFAYTFAYGTKVAQVEAFLLQSVRTSPSLFPSSTFVGVNTKQNLFCIIPALSLSLSEELLSPQHLRLIVKE